MTDMRIIAGRAALAGQAAERPHHPAIAIGNFDGVHRGHRALIDQARARAGQTGGTAGVLTFDPHPARHFAPHLAPPMLTTIERRLELLGETGIDFVVVEPFGAALANMEADDFVRTVLARDLGARNLVVGYNFHFGKGRRGDPQMLCDLGRALGITVDIVPEVTVDGLVCSSTKIREFVLEGRVEGAQLLLGRPFEITGTVIAGARRGRDLGFPTANLQIEDELLPRTGIYAGFAVRLDAKPAGVPQLWPAAISVGSNPTFTPGAPVSVEAHLIDFADDLYGTRIRLQFLARLRDEARFENVDALVAQIRDDVDRTRQICAQSNPESPPKTKP